MKSGGSVLNIKICKCLDEKSSHDLISVFPKEDYLLKDGAYTNFTLWKCKDCLGYCGYPVYNFQLALDTGTFFTRLKILIFIHTLF